MFSKSIFASFKQLFIPKCIISLIYISLDIIYECFIRFLHAYKNKWKFLLKSLAKKSLIIFCLAGSEAAAKTAQWNSIIIFNWIEIN